MNRRTFLTSLAAAPMLAAFAAACGDPDRPSSATDLTAPGTAPTTTPSPTTPEYAINHPTGPDDVVLSLAYVGGLVPMGYDFGAVPVLLVSGDGRVFQPAPTPAVYPGPLLPSISVRTIAEDGLQALLAIADHAGLLAPPPEYPDRHNVADAQTTVLTINTAGGGFVHSAYGLGIGEPETEARKRLLDAANRLADIDAAAGTGALGAPAPFAATTYRLLARAVEPSELTSPDLPPTIVDWPAGAGITLASASECARVDAAAVGSLFTDAKQNTYFKDADVVYQLSVRGVLPGDPAC